MDQQEEYRLFLDYVVKMIERRGGITTTYLSVNAAIAGIMALIFKDIQGMPWGQQLAGLVLLVAGIVACGLWRRLIIQYSTSLGWWYERLRNLEAQIPNSTQPLSAEYHALYQPRSGKIPVGLTRYETQLTWLFTAIYALLGVVLVVLLIQNAGLQSRFC